MNKEKILGFDVCISDKEDILNSIFSDYEKSEQNVIVNINPEIVINNYKDKEFVENLNKEKYQVPDGIGIVYASKINKGNIKNRIAGIDLLNDICEKSIKYKAKIFLYGAKPEIADKAKQELEKKYSGINIVGVCNGYTSEEFAVQEIHKHKPDILFIGIGSPKQEMFILKNKQKLDSVKIFMPVGGSFDVLSNTLKRAPNWMIKMNLEWLYRLLKQPQRIFRQSKLIKFVFCVIKHKKKGSKKCQK